MRRITVGVTLLVMAGALLALPLTSTGQPQPKPKLADQLRGGLDRTVGNVNAMVERLRGLPLLAQLERERLRREAARREAAKRAQTTPRAPSPGPSGTAYTPPLHGTNPHGQGTVGVLDLPPSSKRPLTANPAGGDGEILVAGRARGEQVANGAYQGHITIAALLGSEILGVNTTTGQTRAGPLDGVQQGILTPLCNATAQGICLSVLAADSATTTAGSTNKFSIATAALGGAAGINAGVATSTGNISEDANCQTSSGTSNVADVSVGVPGTGLSADALEATSTSRKCKDGTATQTNTSKVVNLQNAGLAVPPLVSQACANGTPDSPALINVLLPAVCNADETSSAQAGPVNGVREGLTAFVLDVGGNALTKVTTGAAESRASKNAQCSDGVDNDGDGKIDFPADPGCTSATDDDETDRRRRDDGGGDRGDRGGSGKPECADGKDNDGDGKIDFPADPGCSSAKDDSEAGDGGGRAGDAQGGGTGGATECSDGRDNDGDGKIDFPADPGCSSAADDSEADAGGGAGRLAFTGTNVLFAGLIGSLLLLTGLGLRAVVGGRGRSPRRRSAGAHAR